AGTLASRHRRRRDGPFARSEATRERGYDATGGVDPERLPRLLLEWLIGSGRLLRHLPRSSLPLEALVGDLDSFTRSTWRDLEQAKRMREAWFSPSSILRKDGDGHRPVKDALDKMLAFLGRHVPETLR